MTKTKIKFGTDGWRAIIAKDFTVENVIRISEATASWLLKNEKHPSVVIGYDCRFAGELFAETVAKVMAGNNIKVFLSKNFASTPMVSLGTIKKKASVGIIITASHNPPAYNGIKLKGSYGGPLLPDKIEEIEKLITNVSTIEPDTLSLEELQEKGWIEYIDLETMYCNHLKSYFDFKTIRNSKLNLAYDAMYGTGQNVIKRLLPETTLLHCEFNPSFKGQAPEPIDKNLQEFSNLIKKAKNIDCGLATDGDADRIGLYDKNGNFIDANHLILLLIHYFVKYKGMKGKVAVTFSTSARIKKMCEHYKLDMEITKIGFKYLCGIMIKEDILLGGEESGGIAVKEHIPERDGIWVGLIIWEYLAKSGKELQELIEEVYGIVGQFAFERLDLHLKEELKNKIIENCKNKKYRMFGKYKVQREEDLDGYKYFFNENEWLLIRPSGTEPVLRIYAESNSKEEALNMLQQAKKTLLTQHHSTFTGAESFVSSPIS